MQIYMHRGDPTLDRESCNRRSPGACDRAAHMYAQRLEVGAEGAGNQFHPTTTYSIRVNTVSRVMDV